MVTQNPSQGWIQTDALRDKFVQCSVTCQSELGCRQISTKAEVLRPYLDTLARYNREVGSVPRSVQPSCCCQLPRPIKPYDKISIVGPVRVTRSIFKAVERV